MYSLVLRFGGRLLVQYNGSDYVVLKQFMSIKDVHVGKWNREKLSFNILFLSNHNNLSKVSIKFAIPRKPASRLSNFTYCFTFECNI